MSPITVRRRNLPVAVLVVGAVTLGGAFVASASTPVEVEINDGAAPPAPVEVESAVHCDPRHWQWSVDAFDKAAKSAATPKSQGGHVDDRFFTGEFGALPLPGR
ncbi:MAG: hypothetical protein AAGA42_11175 [Actinomycetota bacterium]